MSRSRDSKRFRECLEIVLGYEGGTSDHKDDPGGATNKGITIATYRQFYGNMKTRDELWNISDREVEEIYESYWDKVKAYDLPIGVDLVVFDGSVHSGAYQSAKWLQRAAFAVEDGIVGPKTLSAVNARDSLRIVTDYLSLRMDFLTSLRHYETFPGWQTRVVHLFNEALKSIDTIKL